MTRFDSPRIATYGGLAAFALIAGLVAGRIELVALAAPFAIASTIGAALARDPKLEADFAVDRDRALEDEVVHAGVELRSTIAVDRVDVFLPLPEELVASDGNPRSVALRTNASRTVELDLRARECRVDGRTVELTRRELDLLAALMSQPGRALSRDALLERVWGSQYLSPKTVDVHVSALRRKLGDPSLIETVRGVGLRLHVP